VSSKVVWPSLNPMSLDLPNCGYQSRPASVDQAAGKLPPITRVKLSKSPANVSLGTKNFGSHSINTHLAVAAQVSF